MKLKQMGKTGAWIPVVGQGTWNLEREDRHKAVAALRQGIDLGMTHLDTAEMYGGGLVEEIVGEAIAGRRDQVFLASKVLPSNATFTGTVEACERSLKRLKTDRLDLYLLHWPSEHPLERTLAAFDDLKRRGKILAYGVSNFDVRMVSQAVAIAGPGTITCDQVLYHLEERYAEHDLVAACDKMGVALVGYSPFGAGRFVPPASLKGKMLEQVGRAHGATGRQVALAFLARFPHAFVIPKASTPEHVVENAGAGDLVLTGDEVHRLGELFALGRNQGGLPII